MEEKREKYRRWWGLEPTSPILSGCGCGSNDAATTRYLLLHFRPPKSIVMFVLRVERFMTNTFENNLQLALTPEFSRIFFPHHLSELGVHSKIFELRWCSQSVNQDSLFKWWAKMQKISCWRPRGLRGGHSNSTDADIPLKNHAHSIESTSVLTIDVISVHLN